MSDFENSDAHAGTATDCHKRTEQTGDKQRNHTQAQADAD
jgi:hypothetical protein